MADLYDNYGALAAAQTEGTDYTRTLTPFPGSTWASIAIHGGGIEGGSGEVAQAVAAKMMNCYVFAGIKASGNSDLHITSTNFDEPRATGMVATSDRTLSFHGFTGTAGVSETAIGGLDTVLVQRITAALTAAGFTVTTAPSEIAGTNPANICNRNAREAGVQLEMSAALRASFFPGGENTRAVRESGQRTDTFRAYVNAIRSVHSQVPEIGVTLATADLVTWAPRIYKNEILYVGPNSDGLPASWSDPRLLYARDVGATPIIAMSLCGDGTKYETAYRHLANTPDWVSTVYVTEAPEPELIYQGNHTSFLDNYREWYVEVINRLPAPIRAKIKVGPVVNKTWTEDPARGGGDYSRFDPGPQYSDFFGLIALHEPVDENGELITTYDSTDTLYWSREYWRPFGDYRYTIEDNRPRLVPLVGFLGLPFDPAENARGNVTIDALVVLANEFTVQRNGWYVVGVSYFHGWRPGPNLAGLGSQRWYRFDVRQSGYNTKVTNTSTVESQIRPLNVWNLNTFIYSTGQSGSNYPGAWIDLPPDPIVPPATIELPPGGLPTGGPAAQRLLAADYTVLITDAQLNVLGDPIHEWTTLQCALKWKEPGSGNITVPATHYIRQQLIPGARVVIIRRLLGTQHILMSGPIEKVLRERADTGENGGVGMLTLSFADDMAWLAARLAFPDPSKPIDQQTADYWNFSGDPEMAMLTLVNTQAGPGALTERRVPKLVVAKYSGVAGTGTVALGNTSDVAPRERLEKLTDVLRNICTLGANPVGSSIYHPDSLGFWVRQTQIAGQNVLLFEPVRSRDLTGSCHFSFSRGNLEYYSFEQEAPSLTHVLIGGSGDTSAEKFVRQVATTDAEALSWGRWEGYVSAAGTETLAVHTAAANTEMAEKLTSTRLATTASDTVDQRYGIHYDIGDVVSVELDADEFVSGPIQTVNLQAWPTAGEVVGVTIGDQSARFDSATAKQYRDLERRLGRQERRIN